MQILDSVVEGALSMPDSEEADALIAAVVRFLWTGDEPEGLEGNALSSWLMVRPALINSRKRAQAGSKGGKAATATSGNKQTRKQINKQNGKQNSNFDCRFAPLSSSSSYLSTEEGVQGEEPRGFEPPSRDEAVAYFGANSLKGDPDAFLDFYESQGWVKSNGRPVADWKAAARMWHRKQRSIDAERAANGEPTQDEAVWRPASGYDPEAEYDRLRREYAERYGEEALMDFERSAADAAG